MPWAPAEVRRQLYWRVYKMSLYKSVFCIPLGRYFAAWLQGDKQVSHTSQINHFLAARSSSHIGLSCGHFPNVSCSDSQKRMQDLVRPGVHVCHPIPWTPRYACHCKLHVCDASNPYSYLSISFLALDLSSMCGLWDHILLFMCSFVFVQFAPPTTAQLVLYWLCMRLMNFFLVKFQLRHTLNQYPGRLLAVKWISRPFLFLYVAILRIQVLQPLE